jgi:hypothetical protein
MDDMLHVYLIIYCKLICQCEKEFILCSIVYEPPSHLRDGGGCTLVGRNTLFKKKSETLLYEHETGQKILENPIHETYKSGKHYFLKTWKIHEKHLMVEVGILPLLADAGREPGLAHRASVT